MSLRYLILRAKGVSAASLAALIMSSPASGSGLAQAIAQKPPTVTAMTNQDVVDLVKGGFGEDLIVAQVQAAKIKQFDVSTRGLIALKAAGVSERILTVMLGSPDPGKKAAAVVETPRPAVAPTQQVSVVAPPTTALSGREAGIYLEEDADRLVQLEPAVFSGGKTGGALMSALTYGIAKVKWKAVVRSPHANQRVYTAAPVFHFYFERAGAGLSNASQMLGATSPNEFVLVRMTVSKTERQLIIGEAGSFGASSGTRSEDTIALKIEKLQSGVYKVTPAQLLTEGEYCFFYAAGASSFMAAGTGKLFDFGVQRK
jgi:hypothetical protein